MPTDPTYDSMLAKPTTHEDAAAHALFAATAQIGLALRESQDPVARLGSLLADLSETLGALRGTPLKSASDAVGASAANGLLEKLQAHVFQGIQQLQFYDRLVQHMSHVQDYLISVANELGPLRSTESECDPWDEMHARLRRRLISDEQRGLLDLFLSPDTATRVSAQANRPDYSPPGSSELF